MGRRRDGGGVGGSERVWGGGRVEVGEWVGRGVGGLGGRRGGSRGAARGTPVAHPDSHVVLQHEAPIAWSDYIRPPSGARQHVEAGLIYVCVCVCLHMSLSVYT